MPFSVKEKMYISEQSKNIRNKQDETSTLLNVPLTKVTVHARSKNILRREAMSEWLGISGILPQYSQYFFRGQRCHGL